MTLRQTQYTGLQRSAPVGDFSGDTSAAAAKYVFTTAFTAASDQLELFTLPANHRVVDMVLLGDVAAAVTANVGFMSGTPGDGAASRTVGTEFFSAASLNGVVTRPSLLTAFRQAPSSSDRLIGMTISADVAALASKSVELIVFYAPMED